MVPNRMWFKMFSFRCYHTQNFIILKSQQSLNRSGLYYKRRSLTENDVVLMNEIRDIYIKYPFFGYRKVHALLKQHTFGINRKKVQRLMQIAGLRAIYPKKRTTFVNKGDKIYPYLLKELTIVRPDQVWQVDITYIKIRTGFVYLVCLIDVFSRRIMGWSISPFLDTVACKDTFESAIKQAKPDIINSDQGSQFTSTTWCTMLIRYGIKISMDGKGSLGRQHLH